VRKNLPYNKNKAKRLGIAGPAVRYQRDKALKQLKEIILKNQSQN